MSKDMGIAIGAGIASALAFFAMFAVPIGALLGYWAALPLLLAGLSLGPRAGTIAALAGVMIAGLIAGGPAAGNFAVGTAGPAWVIGHQALLQRPLPQGGGTAWYPAGSTLSWLAVIAAGLLVTVAATLYGNSGLEAMIQSQLEQAIGTMLPSLEVADRAKILDYGVPFFPGIFGVAWVVMMAVNGIVAQALLVRRQRNIRPAERFADLTLPSWASWLVVAAAIATVVGSGDLAYAARNAALILAAPFFFLGLAVVHAFAARTGSRGTLLSVFYGILVFSLLISAFATYLVIAGVGMVEAWSGIRRRLAAPDDEENE